MQIILKLFQLPFINTLTSRLVNRFTAHGIAIVALALESQNVLPRGTTAMIDGMPTKQIWLYLAVAIGVYFIFRKGDGGVAKAETKLHLTHIAIEQAKAEAELKKLQQVTGN